MPAHGGTLVPPGLWFPRHTFPTPFACSLPHPLALLHSPPLFTPAGRGSLLPPSHDSTPLTPPPRTPSSSASRAPSPEPAPGPRLPHALRAEAHAASQTRTSFHGRAPPRHASRPCLRSHQAAFPPHSAFGAPPAPWAAPAANPQVRSHGLPTWPTVPWNLPGSLGHPLRGAPNPGRGWVRLPDSSPLAGSGPPRHCGGTIGSQSCLSGPEAGLKRRAHFLSGYSRNHSAPGGRDFLLPPSCDWPTGTSGARPARARGSLVEDRGVTCRSADGERVAWEGRRRGPLSPRHVTRSGNYAERRAKLRTSRVRV